MQSHWLSPSFSVADSDEQQFTSVVIIYNKYSHLTQCVLMAVSVVVHLFCKLKWELKLGTPHDECVFVWHTH